MFTNKRFGLPVGTRDPHKDIENLGRAIHDHLLALENKDALAIRWDDLNGFKGLVSIRDWGAKGDGVSDDSLAFTKAAAEAKFIYIPHGTYLINALTIPSTVKGIFGAGKNSILKPKRVAYGAGAVIINADALDDAILQDFSIDCDDAVFESAGTYALTLQNTTGIVMRNVRVSGKGESACLVTGSSGMRAYDLTVDCTGAAAASFNTCFYGQSCNDVVVTGMRVTGNPTYGGAFGDASVHCKFVGCHVNGTEGGFGLSLGGCSRSAIIGCSAWETSHEAFQLTNCDNCLIEGCIAEWDTNGADAGISVNGESGLDSLNNRVANNIVINSFDAGLLCANNSKYNVFENNTLVSCCVDNGAVATAAAIKQYTDISAAACDSNTFRHNKVVHTSGSVQYGYAEFNNGGGGSVVQNTSFIDNEWQGAGTWGTARSLFVSYTTANISEVDFTAYTPTITSAAGTLTATSVTTSKYRPRGQTVEVQWDVTITTNGTGATAIDISFPTNYAATSNGGMLNGREAGLSGSQLQGLANSTGARVWTYNNAYPGGSGARIIMSGWYRRI